MIAISANYRKLSPEEVPAIAAELDKAWQDPNIPMRQWVSCVRGELERYRNGERLRHFDVLIDALKRTGLVWPTLLDVGAGYGFYSEVLKIGGFPCIYRALDYSEAHEYMAQHLFGRIDFDLGDARSLPYANDEFDIVLSGCVMLHVAEYEKVIAETARVAKHFAIFHRTPVTGITTFHQKEAYGVPCLEIWFGEEELLGLFAKYGLELVSTETIADSNRTYLLRKA